MMELNKIYCGDNCDLLGELPRECIDLVVTSPPYDDLRTYGGHTWDFEKVANELFRVTKDGGAVVWIVADATINGSETGTSFSQALYFKEIGFNLHDTMIWHKGCFTSPQTTRYPNSFEYMFIFSKGLIFCNQIKDRKNKKVGTASIHTIRKQDGKTRNMYADCRKTQIGEIGVRFNVWDVYPEQSNHQRLHPAQFPERLAADHIISWSNPGDLVLDPFTGSGTTCKAAKELGRNFLGFEINPEYCKIAERRIAQEVLDFAS